MSVGIALSVTERAEIREKFVHSEDKIGLHIRVGVFVYGYRGGGVRTEYHADTLVDSALGNRLAYFIGYVDEPLRRGAQTEIEKHNFSP